MAAATSRLRRALRLARRLALIALAVLGVVLAAALIVVHTDWGRGLIRDRVVAALRETFPGGAELGALDGSVLGDLVLTDLVINDRDGRAAIEVARLELNLGLGSLLAGTIRLEHVTATGVVVRAHQAPGGRLNLADLVAPSDEPSTWDVALDRITVGDATIIADLAGEVATIDQLELTARAALGADHTIAAAIEVAGRWRETGDRLTVRTATVEVGADGAVATQRLEVAGAGLSLTARDVRYAGPTDARGVIAVAAAPGALERFVPALGRHPAVALTLAVAPEPDRAALGVAIDGTAGATVVTGRLVAVPVGEVRIGGVVHARGVDLHAFAPGAVSTDLATTVQLGLVLDTALPGGQRGPFAVAAVAATGRVGDHAATAMRAAATLSGRTVDARATAAGAQATATVAAMVTLRPDGAVSIDDAHVIAGVGELAALVPASGVAGRIEADLRVTGTISDRPPVITVDGVAAGRRLRGAGARAVAVDVTLDRFRLDLARPNRPGGAATVVVAGGAIGDQAVPTTTIALRGRPGGSYALTASSAGDRVGARAAPWSVELAATVHPGADDRSAVIDLGGYRLRARGLPWTGDGGRVTVTPDQVVIERVAGQLAGGRVTLDGEVGLGGRDRLDATVVASGLRVAELGRALALDAPAGALDGVAELTVDLHRRGRAITGAVTGRIRGLTARPGADPLDVTVDATVERHAITATVAARGRDVGAVTAAIDVAPPAVLTDRRGWAALDRTAIRSLTVRAELVDAAAIARALGIPPPIEGTFGAELDLGAAGAVGELRAAGVRAPGVPGLLDVRASLDLADLRAVAVTATVALRDVARGTIDAAVRIPARPFDGAAWAALDLTAVRRATITIDELTVDDRLARRLGLGTWRGRIGASIDATDALAELHARVALRGVTGAAIERPIDVVVDGALAGSRLDATASAAIDGVTVATAAVTAPVDLERIAAVGVVAATADAPLAGTVTVARTALAALLGTLGGSRPIAGVVHGDATVAGTLGDPTARGSLVFEGLGGARTRIPELRIDGSYASGKVTARLAGDQEGGGSLLATASYDRAAPAATVLALEARQFQLAPLTRLVPELLGVRGVLDADLRVVGTDPVTARPSGIIKIAQAQIPILDSVGALTGATIDLGFTNGDARLVIAGQIESGKVELVATAALDGLLPRAMTIDASVANLTIISTAQPRIAATLHAEVALAGDHWTIAARLRDGRVVVPDASGAPLHAASPPADLVFVERGAIVTPPRARAKTWFQRRPSRPLVLVALRIDPVAIVSKELRGDVGGKLDITAGDDGVSIDGQIEARTGEVVVFDRRYLIERAQLAFDGPPDPLLDILIQHEFPTVVLRAGLRGRLSDPKLELTSSPAVFSESQLLGFLLGGTPGAPGRDAREVVSGAAAAVAAQTVGGFLTRRLPVRVDVLRYEPASASRSAAFAVGRWVSEKLLVLVRTRVEPRLDENRSEAELEYWLTNRTLIDATGGDRGVLGLDLLWTKRW